MKWIRPLLYSAILLVIGVTSPSAVESGTYFVPPGVAELEFDGMVVRVEASDDVIVRLSIVDGALVGQVSAAPGTFIAQVVIVVADDPERIIFQGRVVAPTWFSDYLPQETGRGEQ